MQSKKVLITGANTGIGFTTAQHLLNQGADVILACRNPQKAQTAQKKLLQLNKGKVDVVQLDLNSLHQVRQAADEISQRFGVLDILINNAGLFGQQKILTDDGFEQQFGVNYLGHFLLTQRLLPSLQQAPAGRIIHLASVMHWAGAIKPDTFRPDTFRDKSGFYNPVFHYGQSKLANLLFSHALAKQLEGTTVTSNALHPGGVDSDIYRDLPKPVHKAMQLFLVPTRKPAQLITDMALSEQWQGRNGEYMSVQTPAWQSRHARNQKLADDLYAQSLTLVQPYL